MLVRTDSLRDFLGRTPQGSVYGWLDAEGEGRESLGGPAFSLYDRVCGAAGSTTRGTASRPVVFELLTRPSISF